MSTESTALAIRDPQALATPQRNLRGPLSFDAEARKLIRESFMPGATEGEAAVGVISLDMRAQFFVAPATPETIFS